MAAYNSNSGCFVHHTYIILPLSMEITNKQSLIGREEFYFAKLRTKTQETQIQEALELDPIRLHNGGSLYRQKLQNYVSCLSRIMIGAGKKQVQFSCSVMSNSLQPHGLQHTRLPCSSPIPGACSNSCPSSW